jgi:hypothetical protein
MRSKRISKVNSAVMARVTTSAENANSIEVTTVETLHNIKMLSVDCLPEIGRHFYIGEGLLHINELTTSDDLMELECNTGSGAVLPVLKAQVESLLGAGNYEYAYHHIGPYQVSLSWLIKSAGADETVNLITAWLRYAELGNIITVETITLTDREYQLLTGA